MVEAARDSQCGRGEDDAGVVVEERVGKQLGDVARRSLQMRVEGRVGCTPSEVANPSGGSALDPEDCVAVAGFEQKCQMGADVGCTLAQPGGLFHILNAVEFAFKAGKSIESSSVIVAALLQELLAELERHPAHSSAQSGGVRGEGGEEHARTILEGRA